MTMTAHSAWHRKQGVEITEGGRFAGLRDALRVAKGNSVRLAAHRAEKVGDPVITRSESTKAEQLAAKAAARPAASVKPSPPAATAPAKPQPIKVPAHVEARGQVYADAYRSGFTRVCDQMARLQGHAAVKGRYGSTMMLVAEGLTDDQIIARLPNALTDRQRASDRVWERAIAAVHRPGHDAAADQPKQATSQPDSNDKAAALWARAYAAVSNKGPQ